MTTFLLFASVGLAILGVPTSIYLLVVHFKLGRRFRNK